MKVLNCAVFLLINFNHMLTEGSIPNKPGRSLSEELFRDDFNKGYELCKGKSCCQPDKKDIERLENRAPPQSEGGKCLLTCIFEKGNLSQDMQFSTGKIRRRFEKQNPRYLGLVDYVLRDCNQKIGHIDSSQECELGPKIMKCLGDTIFDLPVLVPSKTKETSSKKTRKNKKPK